MTKNFSNLVKSNDTLVYEVQIVPTQMIPKKITPRHIIIKLERILKEKKKDI